MTMHPYVSFKGDCEAAFTFYEQCLGATRADVFRYGGSPMAGQAPAGWDNKVMHGSITIGGTVLMAADIAPEQYEPPSGFNLSLQIKDAGHAERIFRQLAEGGRIVMALEKTFWAERFGMVVDRFGVPWLINCEGGGS